MHGPLAVEREQRLLVAARSALAAPFELLAQERGDPRSVRNETALAELPAADHDEITARVDVTQPQPAHLAGAEPQNRPIGCAPLRRASVVRKVAGRVKQPACLDRVKQERDPVSAAAAP